MLNVIMVIGWLIWWMFSTKIGRMLFCAVMLLTAVHAIRAAIFGPDTPAIPTSMSETDVPNYVTVGGVIRGLHDGKTGFGDYVSFSVTNNGDLATPAYSNYGASGMWLACSVNRDPNGVPGDGSDLRLLEASPIPDIHRDLVAQIIPAHSTQTLEFDANASGDFRVRKEHFLRDCVMGGSASQAAAQKRYQVDDTGDARGPGLYGAEAN